MMAKISERIKLAMSLRGMKQVDLVNITGIGKSSISTYLAGDYKPKQQNIHKIAKALDVSEAWLMGFDVPMERESNSNFRLETYNPVMHKIPILGNIAAGTPIFAEENIKGFTYTDLNGGASYFALEVHGDSMTAANIPDGSLVIVRQQEEVENGQIAAVRVNNEFATIKRFKQEKNIVQLIPQSHNPNHSIQIYDLKTDTIDVLGKVVECKTIFN